MDAQVIPRFAGIRTFMRLPHVTELEGVDAAAVGIPFDTGTSYRSGARFGPEAIRSASALLRPFHPVLGIAAITRDAPQRSRSESGRPAVSATMPRRPRRRRSRRT
jgi:agmatinase